MMWFLFIQIVSMVMDLMVISSWNTHRKYTESESKVCYTKPCVYCCVLTSRPISAVRLSHDGGTIFSVSHGMLLFFSLHKHAFISSFTSTDKTLKAHLIEDRQLLRSSSVSNLVRISLCFSFMIHSFMHFFFLYHSLHLFSVISHYYQSHSFMCAASFFAIRASRFKNCVSRLLG